MHVKSIAHKLYPGCIDRRTLLSLLFTVFFLFFFHLNLSGQSSEREVYLSFKYRGVVNQVVTAYYKSEKQQFFLPLTQMLNLLGIPYEINQDKLRITGSYLDPQKTYKFDFKNQTASYDGKRIKFTASDYLIKELDYFVRPALLNSLLGLNFDIDFNSLSIALRTNDMVPVVAAQQREKRRQRELQSPRVTEDKYPLQFKRNRAILDGGFLDYNLSSTLTNELNFYTYNTTFGVELLGGDLQGSAQGSWSQQVSNFTTSNLRWRYVMREKNWLTSIRLGQNSTDGLRNRQFTGIKLSNDPIEPRLAFDEYVIQGQVPPQSEVELYLNNTLIDFQQADELGNYRFVAPLTFGSSRYRLKIFTPSGGVQTIQRRIQVPFEFQKPGNLRYNISAGRLNQPLFGTTNRGYVANSDVAYGLSEQITIGGGFEHLEASPMNRPLLYATMNTRLLTSHLVNIKAVPNAFYRVQSNAVYPSSAGWSMDYTYYTGDNLYNIRGLDHELNGNIFTPFNIGPLQFNTRLFISHIISGESNITRYRADMSTRISRLTIRTGFNDQQIGNPELSISESAQATASFTYTLPRNRSLPTWIRGAFIRGNLRYTPGSQSLERTNIEISRSIAQTGRIRLSAGRDFNSGTNNFLLGFTINFAKTRSSTTARSNGTSKTLSQTFRGSIGYDSENSQILFDNRQQVGRAAAAVRLYVDENNDADYDKGEKLIKDNAVKLEQSSDTEVGPDGIVRVTQLRAYNRLNANIQKSALSNPLYIPEIDTFSFVADPNQFKPLNIPFYQSGVISGKVFRIQQGQQKAQPQSGIRVFVKSEGKDFRKKMRTFSDGSFYSMKIPPGDYKMYIDRSQLEFLGAVSRPDTLNITVENKAQGDFIENLKFTIRPSPDTLKKKDKEPENITAASTSTMTSTGSGLEQSASMLSPDSTTHYYVQLAAFQTLDPLYEAVRRLHTYQLKKYDYRIQRDSLFLLVTNPFHTATSAIQALLNIRKIYPDAMLISDPSIYTSGVSYKIHFNNFSSRADAAQYARKISEILDYSLTISRKEYPLTAAAPYYKVHSGSLSSITTALSMRDRIAAADQFGIPLIDLQSSFNEKKASYHRAVLIRAFYKMKATENFLNEIAYEGETHVLKPGNGDKYYLLLYPEGSRNNLYELISRIWNTYPGKQVIHFLQKNYTYNASKSPGQ